VDDELILSGANLSQEYFFDRQDRYMLFTNGGGGIVDFYADLIEILCEHGYRYQDSSRAQSSTKHELLASLSQLFSGDAFVEESNDIVAYAVPTFQAPEGFFPSSFDFPTDAELTRNLLSTAHEMDSATTVQLASAYLNPTPKLTSTLSVFQRLHLLTAGPKSHGFAPKPNQPRRGDWVPSIFSALYAELETKLPHADFLYYERNGWTFHAKGMWILNGKKSLVAAVVGSGNYGARSEIMDVESNTILVFVDESSDLQMELIAEWKSMCQYAHQGHAVEFPETSWMVKAALSFIRNFF
jgi:CDP-diacylglycerol--glycerol-3-phosphate 3-phosphatidyltransferase